MEGRKGGRKEGNNAIKERKGGKEEKEMKRKEEEKRGRGMKQ